MASRKLSILPISKYACGTRIVSLFALFSLFNLIVTVAFVELRLSRPPSVNDAIAATSSALFSAPASALSAKEALPESADITEHLTLPRPTSPPRHIPGLKCIQLARDGGSREGMGAKMRLNQIAPFLASYYNVKLAFTSMYSKHEYDLVDMFDDCGYKAGTKDTFPEKCVVDESYLEIDLCPRGDCGCMAAQFHDSIVQKVQDGCDIVGARPNRFKTLEFSGCLGDVMRRYFATKGTPKWEYDVIHYRMGDLAGVPGGKSFSRDQVANLITAMCVKSRRDIVVLTEGAPEIPECAEEFGGAKRIVLAADTDVRHVFQIAQHGKSLSMGVSGFSFLMTEMAQPERMVVLFQHARYYRWVRAPKWTLVAAGGARFHFNSKAHMELYAMSNSDSEKEIKFRNPGDRRTLQWNWSVPTRQWTTQMMTPAVL